MAKQKTKEQQEEYDALRQRLLDIATGVLEGTIDAHEPLIADQVGRFFEATRCAFEEVSDDPAKGNQNLWRSWYVREFGAVENALSHLYAGGVRA